MAGGDAYDDFDLDDEFDFEEGSSSGDSLLLDEPSEQVKSESDPAAASSLHAVAEASPETGRNLLLTGAIGFLFSGVLPVVVLYEPDTGMLGGGLGDTYVGLVGGYWQIAAIFFMLGLLPLFVAITAKSNPSATKASIPFFLSLAVLVVVVISVGFLGTILALIPWSGILRFVKHSGFRVEVGPGAWVAIASSGAMLIGSAQMMSREQLDKMHFGWLIPTRGLGWKVAALAVGVFIAAASLRIAPWIALTGTFKGVLPYLGPIDQTGDINWPVGFLPFAGAFEFFGLLALALGLLVSVLRRGVLGPLLFLLGGWLVMIAAGIVGSFTIGGPTINQSNTHFWKVTIVQLHAEVTNVTLGVIASAVLGLAAVGIGFQWLLKSRKELLGA